MESIDVLLLLLRQWILAATLRITDQVVLVFLLLGCIRQRQLRSSPMLLPRFSEEDSSVFSSMLLHLYLQLNLLPRWSLPSRLLAEPLALRLARQLEALEVHSCRFISYVFSTDPLAGSDCVLHRRSCSCNFSLQCGSRL
jgi:hypothetical protein